VHGASIGCLAACATAEARTSIQPGGLPIFHDQNRGSGWDSPTVLLSSSSVLIMVDVAALPWAAGRLVPWVPGAMVGPSG
jgi:hypothetical protein